MSLGIIKICVLTKFWSNINADVCRKFCSFSLPLSKKTVLKRELLSEFDARIVVNKFLYTTNVQQSQNSSLNSSQEFPSALQLKRATLRRKQPVPKEGIKNKQGVWDVKAITTAEEYKLEALVHGLQQQQLYIPHNISTLSSSLPDVIHAVAKYEVQEEPREIFFFREGAIVMWNVADLECGNILKFVEQYEEKRYNPTLSKSESEVMTYCHATQGKQSTVKGDVFVLAEDATVLEKYTFSNAMVLSVKLGIWEATLDNYIDSIEFVTEDLRSGKKLKMSQHEVLRKQGELFALRHAINLSSDLLDTPDFYWDRDDLEALYHQTCNYFSISKRTRVINEKLNHCMELVGLLSTHLSDRHHVRLEWMIIILIMVEVGFETLHYADRYFS